MGREREIAGNGSRIRRSDIVDELGWTRGRCQPSQIYDNLQTYESTDERRRFSEQQSVGGEWRPITDGNNWRAFWVRNTMEFCVHNADRENGPVVVIGQAADANKLLKILFERADGQNRAGAPGGLEWLADLNWEPVLPLPKRAIANPSVVLF